MSNKAKYVLDTSIFTELFKLSSKDFEKKLSRHAPGRRFAAYYTVIEINRGFLKTLVGHYKDVVKLRNVRAAINVLNNEFGGRKAKYNGILEGYLLEFSGPISNDFRIYAGQLENAIFDMTDRANTLVKHFIGHFEDHALALLSLYSDEDYDVFLAKCASSSTVDLGDFWASYDMQLYRIRDKLLAKATPRLTKPELELLLFVNDAMGDDHPQDYEHLSDFVISLECPADHIMVAHDHSFDLLIPAQGKLGGYVAF